MKKITLLVALLGSTYFSNAQVGIGTAKPDLSSQLDISAPDKGILIPRVRLTDINVFAPISNTPVESLLVYNIGTTAGANGVKPGFYYWVPVNGAVAAHWERIVNQTQLDEAISNITDLQGDVSKILSLLKVAFPSNNLVDPANTGDTHGGGMVFTPGATPVIEYVYFDGTNYVKKDITADIINLIKGAESKTTFLEFPANSGKYYYISEATIQANNGVVPTTPFSTGTTLFAGVVLLDIPAEVAQNFSTFLTEITNITNPSSPTNYTVQQVIQNLIEQYSDANITGTMVYTPGNDLTEASFTYLLSNGTQSPAVTFSSIVKANETKTDIATTNVANVINYVYTAEPALNGTPRIFTMNLTQDLITLIDNNTDVKNSIINLTKGNGGVYYNGTAGNLTVGTTIIPAGTFYTIDSSGNGVIIDLSDIVVKEVVNNFNEIVNSPVTVNNVQYDTVEEYIQYIALTNGANVGYTTTLIAGNVATGQLPIPANSFYYVNNNGIKVLIPLNNIVYQGISQFTDTQITNVKNILGDKFTTNNTSVFTGNTITINNVIHYIYKGIFTTDITAGTAETTGITLDKDAVQILSANLNYVVEVAGVTTNGLTASVNDITGTGKAWNMNVGVGNTYHVLSNDLIEDAQVTIEFASTVVPTGLVVTP